jgi:NAD(P)-dependent dehydrogenase (short-subunit alcohol dehydrogenase family)
MKTVIITGSAGLVGSESAYFFHKKGERLVGVFLQLITGFNDN